MEETIDITDMVNEMLAAGNTTEEICKEVENTYGFPESTALVGLVQKAHDENLMFGKVEFIIGPPSYVIGSTGTWQRRD